MGFVPVDVRARVGGLPVGLWRAPCFGDVLRCRRDACPVVVSKLLFLKRSLTKSITVSESGLLDSRATAPEHRRIGAAMAGDDEFKPPRLRGMRPESYNGQKREMKRRLDQTKGTSLPTAVWFLVGSLVLIGLYLFNAFTPSWRQLPPQ